jgi:uncharacterized membrane protein
VSGLARQRYHGLDVLRGSAILLMIVFHFFFDLDYFGVVRIDFLNGPFWPQFRVLIVSLFLLIMGMSLHLASRNGLNKRSYYRRLGLLALYAALVTLGSWYLFPQTYIWFGILHFIAVASVVGLLFARFEWLNLVVGLIIVSIGSLYSHSIFDQPWLQWFGLMTYLPYTEDYVPFIPWFGVVLLGLFLGRQLFDGAETPTFFVNRPVHPAGRTLALAGRHSLHIYMLHQPVLLGLLWLVL